MRPNLCKRKGGAADDRRVAATGTREPSRVGGEKGVSRELSEGRAGSDRDGAYREILPADASRSGRRPFASELQSGLPRQPNRRIR